MFFSPDYHKDNHCESHNNIVRLFKSAGLSGQQEGLYPSIYPDMAVCRIFFSEGLGEAKFSEIT